MADEKQNERMEKLVSLCKRRGFIFPSSEIYGGINGFWDYGPMGVLLKRNIKDAWWHDHVIDPPIGPDGRQIEMVGLDCSIIMNPKVWEASGHLKGFTDPMVTCKECRKHMRADKIYLVPVYPCPVEEDAAEVRKLGTDQSPVEIITVQAETAKEAVMVAIETPRLKKWMKRQHLAYGGPAFGVETPAGKKYFPTLRSENVSSHILLDPQLLTIAPPTWNRSCPECGGELTEARQFNMMFETWTGAMQDSASRVYLRPETAQGIFANFKNVVDTSRVKMPFGIAQIGKAFRNEINPRNYTFRSREFEQMEIEFFCNPADSMKWYEFWRNQRINWYKNLGLRSDHLRPREQGREELAHYSQACTDIEYLFPFSDEPQELEGVAHRGDFDLSQHQKASGKDLSYFDDEAKQRFIPHVVEPSAGADRFTLAVLCEAFTEDVAPDEKGNPQPRTVLKFHPRLAPYKVAVFPLVRKDGMPEIADKLYRQLKRRWSADYDEKSAVGRRYRRHDEIGTPFCVTIDGQTKEDGTVTVRDRDSMTQVRVPLAGVEQWLADRLVPSCE